MVAVAHVIYKADDLDLAVARFRAEGFDVEYGRSKNPRNAVAYFSCGPYLEIISKVHMPAVVRGSFRLLGRRRLVEDMDSVATMRQGYNRIAFEVDRREFAGLSRIYGEHGLRTVVAPIARKDTHGRRLSCRCLMPDDWSVPFFVTPFDVDTHRDSPHPNGVTRIEEISLAGSQAAVDVCRRVGAEERLRYGVGDADISVRFA